MATGKCNRGILRLATVEIIRRAGKKVESGIGVSVQRSPGPSGFTLTELLVVIGIMSVLVGILIAAAQKARDAANRAACANRLRQIGFALINYHDGSQVFP